MAHGSIILRQILPLVPRSSFERLGEFGGHNTQLCPQASLAFAAPQKPAR